MHPDAYYSLTLSDQFVLWVAGNQFWLLIGVVAFVLGAAALLFWDEIVDALLGFQDRALRRVRDARRWLAGYGNSGRHFSPPVGLAILDGATEEYAEVVPDEPAEAGEGDATEEEPFDPLTSPIPVPADEPTPLAAGMPTFHWSTGFTGSWKAINVKDVPDPGATYAAVLLAAPQWRELDKAGTR